MARKIRPGESYTGDEDVELEKPPPAEEPEVSQQTHGYQGIDLTPADKERAARVGETGEWR